MHVFHLYKNGSQEFPCGICHKPARDNQKYTACSLCNHRIHIKCNELDNKAFINIKDQNSNHICINCKKENIPFFPHNNNDNRVEHNSPFLRNIRNLLHVTNHIEYDNVNIDLPDDKDPIINCVDLDINEFNYTQNQNHISFFHQNIATLEGHKDEFENVLAQLNYSFNVIGLSETKIKRNVTPKYNVSLPGYKHYLTPTEMECGGTIIYVSDDFTSKSRKDLDDILYKQRELESTFIEIILPKEKKYCLWLHL